LYLYDPISKLITAVFYNSRTYSLKQYSGDGNILRRRLLEGLDKKEEVTEVSGKG